MGYDINAIKKRIAELSNHGNKSAGSKKRSEKLTYFKPQMGINEVRFLPYAYGDGQPFQQINYYDSRQLTERRIVAPVQWGLPDPVADLVAELEQDRSNDTTWNLMRQLRMKESNYAPVFVRGQENKGVQIWEIGPSILHNIYSVLAHPDYIEEDMMDPQNGFDFTITCTDSGKRTVFNGKEYVVKNYDVQPRRKSSPLAKTKKEQDDIVNSVPNLSEHFKQYAMSEEKLKAAVVNFLSAGSEGVPHTEDTVDNSEVEFEAASKIDAAFEDL